LKLKGGFISRVGLVAAVVCLGSAFSGAAVPTAALADHQSASAHASVIGGHAASIAELPSLAFIQAEEQPIGIFACTGTVVAPRVILTAGHCVEDIESGAITPASGYAVATGIANLTQVKKPDVSLVSQALVYPGFKPSQLRGDAGLLVLKAPVAAPVLPLAAAADNALLEPGTPISIAGWGLTDAQAKNAPAQLQTGSSVIQDSEYCKRQSERYYPFYSPTLQLCAIDTPSHTVSGCFGDSGGPAIAQRTDGSPLEVGIVSTGGPACSRFLPNIFTRVDQVSAWVASWIAAVESGGPAPAITIPRAHPPLLTFSRAKDLSAIGFEEDFKYRFRKASEKRIRCTRIAKEKVKCGVAWAQGGNDYFGTVTIYYAIRRNSVVWNDRYKIHWVDDHCWFHSGHRQTCVVRTRAR
jgi:secreted trypsin-like serine protease